jgi:pimeloyl-ACP methyl ester carboxylesterase
LIVAGSLSAGLLSALLLVFAPFVPARESALLGGLLCGFAVGWVMLAGLSTRFTNQPQRWAWAPAVFMGICGLLLIAFGSAVDDVLSWVWPPALLVLAIWMGVRIHRDLHSAAGRWLLYPVVVILAVASIAGGYETVRAVTAPTVKMPGQLVDVGAYRLHIHCTGSGSPTVVLQPGAGSSGSDIGWIAQAVAKSTRVCVYDRPGRGWSDATDTPQDATQIATDLHTLLQRAHVPGPYVLAGHSFGGRYVLTYAAQYPGDVAGMVLIDSTAPSTAPVQHPASPLSADSAVGRASALVSSLAARFGVARMLAGVEASSLPPRYADETRATGATAESARSTIDEYLLTADASADEAASLTTFGNKPLFVLTAGTGNQSGWMAKQNKLAALSTDSVHHVVPGAAHADLVFEQRPAAVVSQAILDVVDSVRSGQPLDQ